MKKYAFYIIENGERFYFENGEENVVVVSADSPEEAMNRMMSCISAEYEEEARNQIVDELPNDTADYPFLYFVEWDVDLFPNYESEVKKSAR